MSLIQQVLVSAGLGSCYEPASGMPMGYCMGFPKDGPLDLKYLRRCVMVGFWKVHAFSLATTLGVAHILCAIFDALFPGGSTNPGSHRQEGNA